MDKGLTRRIPLRDFPKTFSDAITVCRALRVKYLWIDCLCIVQDCQQDWETQSSKMGDIYCNALFTIIAADAAVNSEAGSLNDKVWGAKLAFYPLHTKSSQGCDQRILEIPDGTIISIGSRK